MTLVSTILSKSCVEISLYFTPHPVPLPPLYMDDICEIREIRIPCRIGIDAWEAECLQTLSVDLRFPVDVALAARGDDISQTVDYRAVADGVFELYEGQHVRLVETVAETIATWVLSNTTVAWVDVSVTKEIAKTAAKTATIFIHRERI